MDAGWREYSYGAYDAAIRAFAQAASQAPPGSAAQLEALYGEATVWDLRRPDDDPKRAAEFYRRVLAADSRSDFAAWSALALARMQALAPVGIKVDAGAVNAAYQGVIDRYPFQRAGEEAFIYLMTALLRNGQLEAARTARAALEKFAAAHKQSDFLPTAHTLLAECARILNEPEQRLAEEIAALDLREAHARQVWERNPIGTFTYNDGSLFKVAKIAETEAGDFAAARRYYRLFLQLNPTEKRGYAARQALARMDQTEAALRAEAPKS